MPPKQMKGESSGSSLVTSWMLPKPKPEEQPEHKNTDDKTPSPTEVAESSQQSPTEVVVDSPAIDYEAEWERAIAYKKNGNDGDDYDDGLATDEADAMAKLVQETSLADTTLQCYTGVKRKREDEAGRGKDTGERKPGQETVRRTSEPPNLRTAKKSTPDLT